MPLAHGLTLLSLLAIAAFTKAIPAFNNGSIASTKAPVALSSSALITQSPMPKSMALSSCIPCVVVANDEGGGSLLSQVFWFSSTISLPLDTMSVFLSEYRNTTITSATIAYSNIDSFTGSALSSQVSMAQSVMLAANRVAVGDYGGFPTFILANGTDGAVPGVATSFAYPTPYVAVAGFMLFTNLASASCALNSEGANDLFTDLYQIPGGFPPDEESSAGLGHVDVQMKETFYIPFDIEGKSDIVDIFFSTFGGFDLDTKFFSRFVASDTALLSVYPQLASCSYFPFGVGPPVLQLPATALTATVTTTIKEDSPYPTDGPAPSNTVRPPVPAQTSKFPQSSPNPGPPNQGSLNTSPTKTANPQQEIPPVPTSPSQPGGVSSPPTYQALSPVTENPGSANQADTPTQPSNIPQASFAATADATAPELSFAGTAMKPNKASQYDLPNIGTISPGGPAVTTNNIVYSLAPSAAALVSNGVSLSITPIAGKASVESSRPGILVFKGTSYTADTSSHFIIAGQTLAPARPAITVSGTPISLAADATAAVVGASTVPIIHGPVIGTPVLTFGGSTYRAAPCSAFVIDSQTLTPGATINVHGTELSYPTGGSIVVIDGITQSLTRATTTPPAFVAPIFTLDGTAHTAYASSSFIIGSQTLAPNGIITVSGTPISYPAAGTDVVTGTSTEAVGIGGLIMSGFGGGAARTSTGVVEFTGSGLGRVQRSGVFLAMAVGIAVSMCI